MSLGVGPAFDRVLVLLTLGTVGVVWWLFQVVIPRSDAIPHLQEVRTALPFAIRFALASTMGTIAAFAGLGLLSTALLVPWLKRRSLTRAVLLLAPLAPLTAIAIGGYGLFLADRISAFAPDPGLHRCACPKELLWAPAECHCNEEGSLWAAFLHREDLERSVMGDRLFYGSRLPPPNEIDRLVIRQTLWIGESGGALGETLRMEGVDADPVTCRYPAPCKSPALGRCGPCQLGEALPKPTYKIREDLHCIDLNPGNGAILDDAFLQLHRTIWEDPMNATEIPLELDPALAIPSEKTEIIGTLRGLEGRTLKDVLLGAGRAPKMRSGGTRICRTTAGAAGPAAGGMDRELSDATSIILRIDVVD